MSRVLLASSVVWLALLGSMGAQQPVDPLAALEARIEAAAQQMDADLPGALEELDHLAVDSIELRKTRPLSATERPVHSRLFVLRARGHIQLLNNEKTEESIRELLRIDPQFAGGLAPREQELFDALRLREGGVVEVSSAERGARVIVGGIDVGVTGDTPVLTSIVAGTYEVRLEKPGFKPATTRVTVVAGSTISVNDLVPERNVPPLALLTDQEGVDVLADNVSLGKTVKLPALRATVSPDESAALDRALATSGLDPQTAAGVLMRKPPVDRPMTIRFRRDCFVEEARTVALADALAKAAPEDALLWLGDAAVLRLKPDVGTLRVTSTPRDADVFLDGQLAGRTPFDREVCAGSRRVRIRHRIGSYNVAINITRGRTEVVDAVLKPDIAFLGGVDATGSSLAPSQELTTLVDRALANAVTSFHLTTRVDLPPEVPRWTEQSNMELVAAADKKDPEAIARLLKQAGNNFDAPLLVSAVRRRTAATDAAPVNLLLFWAEHSAFDRIPAEGASDRALAAALGTVNEPSNALNLVYRSDSGVRVADTALPGASLVIATVVSGSAAADAGLKAGDAIESLDGAPATAAQFTERVRQKQPGDVLRLRVSTAGAPARDVSVPVQRRASRAPVFDPATPANALIAKLNAGMQTATGAERDLLAFSVALAYMRFGECRRTIELLAPLTALPTGDAVGKGAALFFSARCQEDLGDRDRALALYKEASAIDTEVLGDDGASVGALARYRLAVLGGAK